MEDFKMNLGAAPFKCPYRCVNPKYWCGPTLIVHDYLKDVEKYRREQGEGFNPMVEVECTALKNMADELAEISLKNASLYNPRATLSKDDYKLYKYSWIAYVNLLARSKSQELTEDEKDRMNFFYETMMSLS